MIRQTKALESMQDGNYILDRTLRRSESIAAHGDILFSREIIKKCNSLYPDPPADHNRATCACFFLASHSAAACFLRGPFMIFAEGVSSVTNF